MNKARIAAAFWGAMITVAAGQDGTPADRMQRPIRVDVDAVNILVTVHDKDTGTFIQNLSPDDFEVRENGVIQPITNFSAHTDLPLTIALTIDTSSSVRLKLDFEKEVAADFVYSVMRAGDRALLLEFDTGVTLLHDFTSNPNDLVKEIERLKAGGGTSLYDAIFLVADQKMILEEGRKTVVILSDGADQTSIRTFEEALDLCYQAEVTMFAVSTTRLGADIDHEGDNALRQLTRNTGGKAFFPTSTHEMTKSFQEVNEILRNQYSITYRPLDKTRDGKFREIKVRLKAGHNAEIRHRKGYYAN